MRTFVTSIPREFADISLVKNQRTGCSVIGYGYKMKRFLKAILYTVITISIGWIALTVAVERTGPEKTWEFGNQNASKKVILVYDPDPFFNLDEQVCKAYAQVLGEKGLFATVASVAAARKLNLSSFDVYVFCANTYNWGPDLAMSNYIEGQESLGNKPVVAITLGAGSTTLSQERFEELITNHGGKIVHSSSVWLLRPNEETQRGESNIQAALVKVQLWATSMAGEINNVH